MILFGEHAVVYGRPAIAVPVAQVRATCTVRPTARGSGLVLEAADLHTIVCLADAPASDALAAGARLVLAHLGVGVPDTWCTIRSTIPIGGGLGSGAAVATALVRALAAYHDHELPAATVSDLVFEIEKIHHGTPSGIDNTVVAYEQPVLYQRGRPIQRLRVGAPLALVIGDTGRTSSTRAAVDAVRRSWEQDPARFEGLFTDVGRVVEAAGDAIRSGDSPLLGRLMNLNQALLARMGVSSPELDRLVAAARGSGALGAKLAGAGRGGSMVALTTGEDADQVAAGLRAAGAAGVIATCVAPDDREENEH